MNIQEELTAADKLKAKLTEIFPKYRDSPWCQRIEYLMIQEVGVIDGLYVTEIKMDEYGVIIDISYGLAKEGNMQKDGLSIPKDRENPDEPAMSQFLNKEDFKAARAEFDRKKILNILEEARIKIRKLIRPNSPYGEETQLQILQIMALHGTPEQKEQVETFLGLRKVAGQEQYEDLEDNGKEDYTIPISAKRIIAMHNALVAKDVTEAYNQLFWALYHDDLDAAFTAFGEIRAKVV